MNKPKLDRFTSIMPIVVHQYERYLPTAFDESLTLLEKVNKVIEYMNTIGKITEESFQKWNEIMDWVMNDGLNDSIITRLNEMMDNGEFDTIINQQILGSRARIDVTDVAPSNPDTQSFWYDDSGNFDDDNNVNDGGIIVADDEPSDTSKVWYDIL